MNSQNRLKPGYKAMGERPTIQGRNEAKKYASM